MIFVTVGTHEQPFNRLVKKVDDLKKNGIIQEDVIIQTGFSTYEPQYCQWSKLIPYQQMVKNVEDARIVITHGGPASFIMPLQIGKTPIVVPRQHQFNEHVNDHQVEFARNVAKRMGLDKWFTEDQLIVSAGVGVAKPDVQIFRMAEEKWGMKPENTFMIGDSLENDIAGAKNAGWKTIWMNHHRYTVPEGMEKPDYIAYTEEELRKLIVQICFTTKKDG